MDALADGELGTAASETELSATISRSLDEPNPDSADLAAAVHVRFGHKQFGNNVLNVLNRLMEVP